MGNRLSKIYTKTGDTGQTAISDGHRIPKTHPRIRSLGALDQLNAQIGLLLCEHLPPPIRETLMRLQHQLFDLGGEISMPELQSISTRDIEMLEAEIDQFNEALPALKEFILPGGSRSCSVCHLARTQCRTTEIALVELAQASEIRPEVLSFLNRLSDWFFVACRLILKSEGKAEVMWKNSFERPSR